MDEDELARQRALWRERYGDMVPEKIVDTKIGPDGKRYYKVQWAATTMEPGKNFLEAELLIKKYWDPVEKRLKFPSEERRKQEESQEGASSSKMNNEETNDTNEDASQNACDEKETSSSSNSEVSNATESFTNDKAINQITNTTENKDNSKCNENISVVKTNETKECLTVNSDNDCNLKRKRSVENSSNINEVGQLHNEILPKKSKEDDDDSS